MPTEYHTQENGHWFSIFHWAWKDPRAKAVMGDLPRDSSGPGQGRGELLGFYVLAFKGQGFQDFRKNTPQLDVFLSFLF